MPPESLRPYHYISNRTRIGGVSKAYTTHKLKCFTCITMFHIDKQPKPPFCLSSHPRLVSDDAVTAFGSKPHFSHAAEESNAYGNSSQSIKRRRHPTVERKRMSGKRRRKWLLRLQVLFPFPLFSFIMFFSTCSFVRI